MENKNDGFQKEEMPVAVLLQKIKSGEINPRALNVEDRQACVDFLILDEGLKQTQVAQLLCCTERTIRRDIDTINKRNQQKPSLEFAEKQIGKMIVRAEVHISHLMRIARSPDGSLAEKAQAEFSAWKIRMDLMSKLQTLGYLPLVTQRFEGDLFHHFDDEDSEKSLEEARKTLDEVVKIASQCGNLTPGLEKDVSIIKKKIEEVEIVHDSNKLLKEQNNKNTEEKNDTKN